MIDLTGLSDEQVAAVAQRVTNYARYITTHRLEFFKPYPPQSEFFAMGAVKRERLYQAGNQIMGKTTAGAVETAYHLTGLYPEGWTGRRWDRPVRAWAVGESAAMARDIAQSRLCGEWAQAGGPTEDNWGTGFIPKEVLLGRTLGHGVQNGFDSISVRHVSGGTSFLGFKSYEQGRAKLQSASLDFVWADEEPPEDVYNELLARISMTGGMVFVTFTPLKGYGPVTARFWQDDTAEARRDRGVIKPHSKQVTWLSDEQINKIMAGYDQSQREARLNGEILLGEGAVFDVPLDVITMPHMQLGDVPLEWRKLWSIDFGIGHPFAAVLLSHDPDTDTIRVHHTIKVKDALPAHHVMMMRAVASDVPVSWPHDGHQRQKADGQELYAFYKTNGGMVGMNMRQTHATLPTGGYSTEAGVMEMLTRFREGRLLVDEALSAWFFEYSSYYRKNGLIVKENDDLMSATRIGVIDIRHAKAVPLGSARGIAARNRPAQSAATNPWTGQPLQWRFT